MNIWERAYELAEDAWRRLRDWAHAWYCILTHAECLREWFDRRYR